jgi:hypothetical protein
MAIDVPIRIGYTVTSAHGEVALAYNKHMGDIYRRLKDADWHDTGYLRRVILPEWWEDKLASQPGMRLTAELCLSKFLSIPLSTLQDRNAPIELNPGIVKLKKNKNSNSQILPGIVAAGQAARVVAQCMARQGYGPSRLEREDPFEIRNCVLRRDGGKVSFKALLDECWERGVPVLWVDLPAKSKLVDGMAFKINDRPIIVLSASRKEEPWAIWYLAHEMSHIIRGHLDDGATIDLNSNPSEDPHEIEANDVARRIIYGDTSREVEFYSLPGEPMTPYTLEKAAVAYGEMYNVNPGLIVLNYPMTMMKRHEDLWAVAITTIKNMHFEKVDKMVSREIKKRLDLNDVTDTDYQIVTEVANIED